MSGIDATICSFEESSGCSLINSDITDEVWQLTDESNVIKDNTLNLGSDICIIIIMCHRA